MKIALALAVAFCVAGQARAAQQDYSLIARGRFVATEADCMPCHTQPGGKPWAGGRSLSTPFGTLLSANITPDQQTGIGAWTEQQFVDALQKGLRADGAHLYPAMPYPNFTKMSRQDALAIRAFLATVPAVRQHVTSDQLPFPFDIRFSLTAWNALYFHKGASKPDARKSAEWNRGAYLVQALGHCGACHTAKNFGGADESSRALQGGKLEGWYAPNLTDDARTGLGRWSVDEVVQYLATGHNDVAAAAGPMSEVIENSTSKMPKSDLRAVAVYLKGLPGQGNTPAPVADLATGQAIYVDNCSACHGGNGNGEPRLFPSLAHGASVLQSDPVSLIRVVLQGVRTVATNGAPTAPAMPAFGWKLTDDQIAAVLTYARNAWGNAAPPVSASAVANERKSLSASAE